MAEGGVGGVDQVVVGALAVPDLPAGVAGIGEDRPHRVQGPGVPSAVGVAAGVGGGGAGHTLVVELSRDARAFSCA